MRSTRKIEKQVERRTFIRGVLEGKLYGDVDTGKSDFNRENFYDLEFYDAEITVSHEDLRKHDEGGEFEEFSTEARFPTSLPNPVKLQISNASGEFEFYLVHLEEPKVRDVILEKQVYEDTNIFTTLRGEISGYLRHYETVFEEVEIFYPDLAEESETAEELAPELPIETDESVPTSESLSKSGIEEGLEKEVQDLISSDSSPTYSDFAAQTSPYIHRQGRTRQITEILTSSIRTVRKSLFRPAAHWAEEKLLHFGRIYTYPKKKVIRFGRLVRLLFSLERILTAKGCITTIVIATSLLICSIYVAIGVLVLFSIAASLLSSLAVAGGLPVVLALLVFGLFFALTRRIPIQSRWVVPGVILLLALLASLTNC